MERERELEHAGYLGGKNSPGRNFNSIVSDPWSCILDVVMYDTYIQKSYTHR